MAEEKKSAPKAVPFFKRVLNGLAQSLTWCFDFFASLKLAVVLVLSMATIAAVGTIVESRFDSMTAKKLVYESPYMYVVMILFVINLTCSAMDRFPWKRKHLPFLLAHIGIISLVVGAAITQRQGLDGTMLLEIGETSKFVSLSETDIQLYQTYTGEYYDRLVDQEVDFLKRPPSEKNPLTFKIDAISHTDAAAAGSPAGSLGAPRNSGDPLWLKITDFMPYALRSNEVVQSTRDGDGAGVRFKFQNAMASVNDWIVVDKPDQPAVYEFGPARIVLTPGEFKPEGKNELWLKPRPGNTIQYAVYTAADGVKPVKTGTVKLGASIDVPWKMAASLQILDFFPHAHQHDIYKPVEKPTPATTSAVKVSFDGAESWVGLNSQVRLFTSDSSFLFSYGNIRIPLAFSLTLDKFNVGRYPGSAMAMSYESEVTVPGKGKQTISMNNPLKFEGFTFYQASFQEDQQGKPTASVLSVNRDPGRPIKYAGSMILVSGIIILFSQRNRQREKSELARAKAAARPQTGGKGVS